MHDSLSFLARATQRGLSTIEIDIERIFNLNLCLWHSRCSKSKSKRKQVGSTDRNGSKASLESALIRSGKSKSVFY